MALECVALCFLCWKPVIVGSIYMTGFLPSEIVKEENLSAFHVYREQLRSHYIHTYIRKYSIPHEVRICMSVSISLVV